MFFILNNIKCSIIRQKSLWGIYNKSFVFSRSKKYFKSKIFIRYIMQYAGMGKSKMTVDCSR
jgi:hypothetical protein